MVIIHQPDFIPWMGLFHKIMSAQQVIIFDSVQISSGKSYSSRVKILLNGQEYWMSIPIKRSGNFGQKIFEVEILDFKINWKKNLGTIKQAYAKTNHFTEIYQYLEEFLNQDYQFLSQFNQAFMEKTTVKLGGKDIQFLNSSHKPELVASESKRTDYIIETCKVFDVKDYISGVGCLTFLEEEKFKENVINITFQDFNHPVYKQYRSEIFVPGLSIIDSLMNIGFEETSKLIAK